MNEGRLVVAPQSLTAMLIKTFSFASIPCLQESVMALTVMALTVKDLEDVQRQLDAG